MNRREALGSFAAACGLTEVSSIKELRLSRFNENTGFYVLKLSKDYVPCESDLDTLYEKWLSMFPNEESPKLLILPPETELIKSEFLPGKYALSITIEGYSRTLTFQTYDEMRQFMKEEERGE